MNRKIEDEWIQRFTEMGAFWVHDGNPVRPHALLTNGGHSNGFFNASAVVRNPHVLQRACNLTLNKFFVSWDRPNVPRVGMAIGPAHGATFVAYEVARQLPNCDAGFTEPVVVGGEEQMALRRFSVNRIIPNVLPVEDVLTTGRTTRSSIRAIERAGGVVLDAILVLVNRSGMKELDGRRIFSVIDRKMPVWKPDDCPLCRQGSEAIRPKGNWDRLTASYEEEQG